jgi:hypothetical protein
VIFLPLFKLEAQFGPIENNQNINA